MCMKGKFSVYIGVNKNNLFHHTYIQKKHSTYIDVHYSNVAHCDYLVTVILKLKTKHGTCRYM